MKAKLELKPSLYDLTSCSCMHGYTSIRWQLMSASAWSYSMVPTVYLTPMGGGEGGGKGEKGGRGRMTTNHARFLAFAKLATRAPHG